nr:hypothetical protein [Desulfobacula sp.]
MKISIFKAVALVLIFFLALPPGFVRAEDYEVIRQAQTAVDNAAARIRMAEGAVGQVLMEAMSGKYGELHKWRLIDDKMADLEKTIEASLAEIGSLAGTLVNANPNYRFPSVTLGHPFAGNLNMARNKKNELLSMAKEENAKLQKLNNMLTKVNKALYNAAKGAVGSTVEGFMPSEIQLGGEGAVLVLGAYFGPPGMVVAGLAVFATFTFNSAVSLYYTSAALADQVKALTPMQEMIAANIRTAEQNVSALNTAAQEMNQIEKVLDQQQKKLEGFREIVDQAEQGWGSLAQGVYQAKQEAAVAEAMAQASKPREPYEVPGSFHGMPPISPVQPSEYSGDVHAVVAEMESYSKAVEDGGDPDIFYERVSSWEKKWRDKYQPIKEDFDKKYEAYRAANQICSKALGQAADNRRASHAALWSANEGKPWDDAARIAADRIEAAYEAAHASAVGALVPYGQVMGPPLREMARLNLAMNGVAAVYPHFNQRVQAAVEFHTSQFWKETSVWTGDLSEALVKTGEALSRIPYYSKGYQDRADNLDAEISRALEWGADVLSARESLLSTADQLKNIGRDAKEGLKAYDDSLLEVHRIINAGQADLMKYLASHGNLINYPRAGRYHMGWSSFEEFVPDTAGTSERVNGLSEYIKKYLSYEVPDYVEEAKKMDWEGLARIYETKAGEYIAYMDWVEQYVNRQAAAANRLNKISLDTSGQAFYSVRSKTPQGFLQDEFSDSQWAGIAGEIEKYVTETDYKTLPWAGFQPWAGLLPGEKLNAALSILLLRINNEMKSYVQSRSSGYFLPVPEDVIKPVEEKWAGLRPLCGKWEAQSKSLKDQFGNATDEAQKEMTPVFEIWGKMPGLSQKMVQSDYTRFYNSAQWLLGYLDKKNTVLRISLLPPASNSAAQLDNLIGNYRSELEKWEALQRQAREEEEGRWREYEEEQARLKAEDQQKQERSEVSLSAVSALYDQFRQAYESRNDSRIMSFMGDAWEAGDGTTLSDLEENISRSFRTFDEIKYTIQNLKIELKSEGRYLVSYDVTITSRIYKRNLKHEEKSSVNEEVVVDGSGKPRIARTMNGRFWYVE